MSRSLGLSAYRAWSRRGESAAFTPSAGRPKGELVWIHAAETAAMPAILDLAQRICAMRYGVNCLVTLPAPDTAEGPAIKVPAGSAIRIEQAPSDHPATVKAFFDHWSPGVGLWAYGLLRPNLVAEALERGCPMILIDGDTGGFDSRRDRWLPEVTRLLLSRFSALMVRSPRAAARLEQFGLPPDRVTQIAPLQAGGQALPCNTRDLNDLSATLAGRPVWLATGVQEGEVATVLAAHRRALRLSHRLLLILHLAEGVPAETCAGMAQNDGFRLMLWPESREPDDSTQVLLADDGQDLGLFLRVAPVTFLGSSLAPGFGGRDPFEAAALGSAVLYGPNVRRYLPFYTRLANAGAARIVNDASALGTAITRLIAPDQAAAMAHAGWDVVSQGAAVTDKVCDLVQAALDEAGAPA